jgi:hypothetical protein
LHFKGSEINGLAFFDMRQKEIYLPDFLALSIPKNLQHADLRDGYALEALAERNPRRISEHNATFQESNWADHGRIRAVGKGTNPKRVRFAPLGTLASLKGTGVQIPPRTGGGKRGIMTKDFSDLQKRHGYSRSRKQR